MAGPYPAPTPFSVRIPTVSYICRILRKCPVLHFVESLTLHDSSQKSLTDRTRIDDMTRRPRMVSSTAPGRGTVPALPTIVLVDPDEDARAMIRDALVEGARPSILRAVADPDALEAFLRDASPSLVLVSLELPGEQGLAAIRAAKAARPAIPVIALSQRPDPGAVAAAYEAGASTVLPRPVTFLALVRLMKVFTAYWLEAAALPPEAA
jgi:CheY-like chemotaxis protein